MEKILTHLVEDVIQVQQTLQMSHESEMDEEGLETNEMKEKKRSLFSKS
jgi:hypothetical protein